MKSALGVVRTVIRRNPALIWFAVVVLVMLGAIWLPTPLRRNFWKAVDSIYSSGQHGVLRDEISANGNDDKSISIEFSSDVVRRLMAKAAGLSLWRLEDFTVTVTAKDHSWTANRNAPVGLAEVISLYASTRVEGHTPEYARAVLSSFRSTPPDAFAFLSDIRMKGGVIPSNYVSQIKKETIDGHRVIEFLVIDGVVAWSHSLSYDKDGHLDQDWKERHNAIEFDPKFESLVQEADQAANERMIKAGISGLGSGDEFWEYKKEYLRVKGYDWRSFSELNPNIRVDY